MRMPPHQFPVQVIQHIRNREVPLIRRHLRIKQHLQQQIAQLLGQVRKIPPLYRVENLVRLFQRVFANRIKRLFAIPRAPTRRPEPRHNPRRLRKQLPRPRRIGRSNRCGSF